MLLAIAVALEWLLLNLLPMSLNNAVLAFGVTGWLLAIGGYVLYILNIRRLPQRTIAASQ
jgi:hypothetical protein